jgi:hypothetical protein
MDLRNAYVDESIHDNHGLYAIAAILAPPTVAAVAESTLRAALPADRVPHWHVEDHPTREKLTAAVATLDVDARVYGCRFETSRRAEAARARALTWFLTDIDAPLTEIVLDRRQFSQNRKDQLVLDSLLPRRRRTVYRHAPSGAEPLLWVADIVAGAACATWLRGADHLKALSAVLSHCEREPE